MNTPDKQKLDRRVAEALGLTYKSDDTGLWTIVGTPKDQDLEIWKNFSPSTNWTQTGELIEKYHIEITLDRPSGAPKPKAGEGIWNGIINNEMDGYYWAHGITPQEAVCRALIASMEKNGDE